MASNKTRPKFTVDMLKPGAVPGVAVMMIMIATGQNIFGSIVVGLAIIAAMTLVQFYFASRKLK